MLKENVHPSDQELLKAADGELSPRRTARVRSHLEACWQCRVRMSEMEMAIVHFTRYRHQTLDSRLPPISGARETLRYRLAQLGAPHTNWPWWSFRMGPATRAGVYLGMAIFITAIVANHLIHSSMFHPPFPAAVAFEPAALPNPGLTPGATSQAAINEVCVSEHEEVVKSVTSTLRQKVFREYGIANADPDSYEIDYLIAPGLGGRDDIRNLWPQPKTSLTWNAEVKDQLEEHLHRLVCSGELDLSTAQRDIASDWIAAYKKYFHTAEPLPPISNRTDRVGAFIAWSGGFER